MTDEIWVQRFEGGEPKSLSPVAFDEVFGPYITDSRPRLHFHRVTAPDGGEADFFADFGPPFASLMASRLSGGTVCELLVSFARRCDAVILLPDGPTLLTDPAQRVQLPAEIGAAARVAAGGPDLDEAIRAR